MLKDYGFKKIIGEILCFEDDDCIISCVITDEDDFPAEIRTKAEEMIKATLEQFQTANHKPAVCEELRLVPSIQLFYESGCSVNPPGYFIEILVYDEDAKSKMNYEITASDPLYPLFKKYMLEQLEKNLFK